MGLSRSYIRSSCSISLWSTRSVTIALNLWFSCTDFLCLIFMNLSKRFWFDELLIYKDLRIDFLLVVPIRFLTNFEFLGFDGLLKMALISLLLRTSLFYWMSFILEMRLMFSYSICDCECICEWLLPINLLPVEIWRFLEERKASIRGWALAMLLRMRRFSL